MDREARRRLLDTKLETLESQIESLAILQRQRANLATERNKLAPVESFPPELLVEAFSYLPELPSAAVMHVSRRWHQICIGVSCLWTIVKCEKWNGGMIDLATRPGAVLCPIAAARAMAPTLQKLDLGIVGKPQTFAALEGVEFPCLHVLRLRCHAGDHGMSGDEDGDDDDHAPVVSDLPVIPGLRELSLDRMNVDLGGWMRASPLALTRLSLYRSGPIPVYTLRMGRTAIRHRSDTVLGLLQKCSIEEGEPAVAQFVQHLTVPPGCGLWMTFDDVPSPRVEPLVFVRKNVISAFSLKYHTMVISARAGSYFVEMTSTVYSRRQIKSLSSLLPEDGDEPLQLRPFIQTLWVSSIYHVELRYLGNLSGDVAH
ncbi:F-box domain-containing protein [Mycena kentingensis (nom. inval.)]|nr:F-box domain-containing protein [Mycena kentingensis (nom. inval.)]